MPGILVAGVENMSSCGACTRRNRREAIKDFFCKTIPTVKKRMPAKFTP
jgi:hypothetical protein